MSENFELVKLEAETMFKKKSMAVAYIFLILLGGLGIHRFYLGDNKIGLAFVVLCVLIMFTNITALSIVLWIAILADIYFVYKLTNEYNEKIDEKIMEYVKLKTESPEIKEESAV
jgi:TM2 domain-containing membrane protein YozV